MHVPFSDRTGAVGGAMDGLLAVKRGWREWTETLSEMRGVLGSDRSLYESTLSRFSVRMNMSICP